MDEPSVDDQLLADLRAIRPEQDDVYARRLYATLQRSLLGATAEPFRFGRFTVLGRLGSGGMGAVFVAYDPVLDRKIALKVLHERGESARHKVLREGRALARLKHPNVVAVYEVGELDDHVFVAMEHVDGQNLRDWLARPRSGAEILARLVEAGRGLAAAHAVDLVHRDFKPENVVIAADGHARVVDFGLARPVEDLPGSASPGAATANLSGRGGTPAYMAPERLAGAAGDRLADQYSFAFTCWEALTNTRPAASSRPAAASRGRGVPGWLRRVLERGLSAAPGDRYPSMDALLAALQADPQRRRRLLLAAAAVAVAVAVGFAVQDVREARQVAACTDEGASVAAVWSDAARDELRAGLLATGVVHAAATADRVEPLFAAQAAALGQARTEACLNVAVRGVWDADTLDRAAWCIDEQRMDMEAALVQLGQSGAAAAHAAIDAAVGLTPVGPCLDPSRLARLPPLPRDRDGVRGVQQALARSDAQRTAGAYEASLVTAEAALTAAQALGWPPLTALARERRGALLQYLGKYAEAEATLEEAYFEAAGAGALEVAAQATSNLTDVVGYNLRRGAEALRWSRLGDLAFAGLEAGGGAVSARRIEALLVRARVLNLEGDVAEAKALFERTTTLAEQLYGPDHPQVATLLVEFGNAHFAVNDYAAALPLYERALAIQERTLGPDHPDYAITLNNLANVRSSTGAYAEAQRLLERAVVSVERSFGPDHPDLADTLANLAFVHRTRGALAEAQALYERALAIREKALAPDHPDIALSHSAIANLRATAGSFAAARTSAERALAIRERTLDPDHWAIGGSLISLADIQRRLGAYAEARVLLTRALAIAERAFGPEHVNVALVLNARALLEWAAADHAAARVFAERALAMREKLLGPDNPDLAVALYTLGVVRGASGAHAEAEALLRRALAFDEQRLGPDHRAVGSTLLALAKVMLARDRPADAQPLVERAVAIFIAKPGPAGELAAARFALARALWAGGRDREQALALARQARDGLLTAEGVYRERPDVEAFLAEHAPP